VVGIPDLITYANFGDDRLRGLGVAGGQNLPFSIDFDRRPYNTLALPCDCVIPPCTIATPIVHSKLDYCNSLYYNIPKSQITRLQLIHNSLARAVVNPFRSRKIFVFFPPVIFFFW